MNSVPVPIRFDSDGAVATITLNRPDAGNAMNQEMMEAMREAVYGVAGNPAIRALVITGEGNMFCAGGDVKFFHEAGDAVGRELGALICVLHDTIATLARMDAPVITAINGTAAGAGLSLAVSGDISIAAESAKFCVAYTGVGLSPDGGSTHFLPRLIGLRRARELMLSNRVIGAEEALALGMIDQVVPDAALRDAVYDTSQRYAAGPTRAFGRIKRLLADSYATGLEDQLDAEGRAITASAVAPDGQEGFAAFVAKRKPRFTGA